MSDVDWICVGMWAALLAWAWVLHGLDVRVGDEQPSDNPHETT